SLHSYCNTLNQLDRPCRSFSSDCITTKKDYSIFGGQLLAGVPRCDAACKALKRRTVAAMETAMVIINEVRQGTHYSSVRAELPSGQAALPLLFSLASIVIPEAYQTYNDIESVSCCTILG
ncbi:hypothetical protein M513_01179, partial [Trichuris suis]